MSHSFGVLFGQTEKEWRRHGRQAKATDAYVLKSERDDGDEDDEDEDSDDLDVD